MFLIFFFNDTATTEIYTLSLHDALPISVPDRPALRARRTGALAGDAHVAGETVGSGAVRVRGPVLGHLGAGRLARPGLALRSRSEEHTSELQSRQYLVCRLLLEKKKIQT